VKKSAYTPSSDRQIRNWPTDEAGRGGRLDGTRELVVPRTAFLLVYRIDRKAQRVEILRFLHGAQQWRPKR